MSDPPLTDTLELGVPGVPLEPGDHICAPYVSQSERDQIMLPFLRAGLEAGHKCFCVVDSSPTSQVLEDLGDDIDTKAALAQRQLELFTAGETYLRTRPFSTGGILEFWRQTIPMATAEGAYPFSRAVGEMPWALHDLRRRHPPRPLADASEAGRERPGRGESLLPPPGSVPVLEVLTRWGARRAVRLCTKATQEICPSGT
jgi:hypothetical protein